MAIFLHSFLVSCFIKENKSTQITQKHSSKFEKEHKCYQFGFQLSFEEING